MFMKSIRILNRTVLGIFSGLTVILGYALYDNILDGKVQAQNSPILQLQLQTDKQRYFQYEPIHTSLQFVNTSADPVRWNMPTHAGRDMDLLIRVNGGSQHRWRGRDYFPSLQSTTLQVTRAGATEAVQCLWNSSLVDSAFPLSGHVEVQAEITYIDLTTGEPVQRTTLSNLVELDILEPTGRNLSALQYLKNVLEPVRKGDDRAEELRLRENFVRNFADTANWGYEAFDLATILFARGEYDRAEDIYFELSNLEFYHARTVNARLMELAGKLHRPTPRTRRPRSLNGLPIPIQGPPQPPAPPGPATNNIPPPIPIISPTP